MKKLLAILLSVTLLTACGDKKIDASSAASFQSSVQKIAEDLKGSEQIAFQQAIGKIVLSATMKSEGDATKLNDLLKEKLNGKTASEVVKLAESENVTMPTMPTAPTTPAKPAQ